MFLCFHLETKEGSQRRFEIQNICTLLHFWNPVWKPRTASFCTTPNPPSADFCILFRKEVNYLSGISQNVAECSLKSIIFRSHFHRFLSALRETLISDSCWRSVAFLARAQRCVASFFEWRRPVRKRRTLQNPRRMWQRLRSCQKICGTSVMRSVSVLDSHRAYASRISSFPSGVSCIHCRIILISRGVESSGFLVNFSCATVKLAI